MVFPRFWMSFEVQSFLEDCNGSVVKWDSEKIESAMFVESSVMGLANTIKMVVNRKIHAKNIVNGANLFDSSGNCWTIYMQFGVSYHRGMIEHFSFQKW